MRPPARHAGHVTADADGTLTGRSRTSPDAAARADVLLVPGAAGDGVQVHAVDAAARRGRRRGLPRHDPPARRRDASTARRPRGARRRGGAGRPRWPALLTRRRAARRPSRSASPSGASTRPWTTCGRATSSAGRSARFQALKHRLADLCDRRRQAPRRGPVRRRALRSGDDPDLAVAAALAQAYCSRVAVHGGRGVRAAARRDRLSPGSTRRTLPQAGQGRPDRARHAEHASRTLERARAPTDPAGIRELTFSSSA